MLCMSCQHRSQPPAQPSALVSAGMKCTAAKIIYSDISHLFPSFSQGFSLALSSAVNSKFHSCNGKQAAAAGISCVACVNEKRNRFEFN